MKENICNNLENEKNILIYIICIGKKWYKRNIFILKKI